MNKIKNPINKKDEIPQYLYKYRPFDEYTIDMLKNRYIFLCKAENLDDETECNVSLNMSEYINLEKGEVSIKLIDIFNAYLSDLTNDKNITEQLKINKDWISLDELKENIKNIVEFRNNIENQNTIDKMFESIQTWFETENSNVLNPIISVGINAKKEIGICSLSENYDDEEMWEKYANKSTGYCIEYDMKDYQNIQNLIAVNYVEENKRETNLIIQLCKSLLGGLIENLSDFKLVADKSAYISLFCTKYKKWSYQNEWRILGGANSKITAPKINRIIIGKDATKETIDKLSTIGKLYNIEIVKNN